MRRTSYLLALSLALSLSLPAARRGAFLDAVKDSSGVVLGEVLNTSSYYGSDGEIYTDVVLQVRSKVKDREGRLPSTLTFTVPGGQVGDVRVEFSETPAFAKEESVMLMLDENGQPTEKFQLDGGFVPELGKSAAQALEEIVQAGEALPEFHLERANEFARKAHGTDKALNAAITCYALMGPKWSPAAATYKITSTIPADWSTSLTAGAAAWNQGGSPFRFSADAASTNEITLAALTGANILAQTRVEYMPSTNTMRRFTLTFNTAFQWSSTGEASKFDVQGITAHELGHALGLSHPSDSSCSAQTMWSSAAAGETSKRSLESGDKEGLVAIYGSGGTTATPPPAPPPPAPAPTTPTLADLIPWPSTPRAGAPFYLLANGTGFLDTLQFLVKGTGCPTAGCVFTANVSSAANAFGVARLSTAGSFTVAVRNTATGALSAAKPLTVR